MADVARAGDPRGVGTMAIVSFRLGGTDGVSIEAAKWARAFAGLGWEVVTVAGAGPVDRLLPGLAIGASAPPEKDELAAAIAAADVVVVENLCSLPLNPAAAEVVAVALRSRPAIFRHFDLPWERPAYAAHPPPPDDPAWRHVCINDPARAELAHHGIEATRIYNAFDPYPELGDRWATRSRLHVGADELVVLQPTRAIPRKNVGAGLALAEELGAVYWLRGPAEDGYDGELATLLEGARTPVVRGRCGVGIADAYAACDLVTLPSTWEGFGNPALEAGLHGRPLAIGDYPVADELAAYGFRWLSAHRPSEVATFLAGPPAGAGGGGGGGGGGGDLDDAPAAAVALNADIARRHFSTDQLPGALEALIATL